MNYPQYQSHKKVSAVKIAKVDPGADGSLTLELEGGFDNVVISHGDVQRKPRPQLGWYLVVYEGGYLSFSPAQAFEENHTLVMDESRMPPKPLDVLEPAPGARISGSPQHLVDELKARDAAAALKAQQSEDEGEGDDDDKGGPADPPSSGSPQAQADEAEGEEDEEIADAATDHGQADKQHEDQAVAV